MTAPTAPWHQPPARTKTLRTRRAEKAARRAEHWGRRLADAQQDGPQAVAAVTFDRTRSALDKLPERHRTGAYQALTDALDHIRETYAQ